MTPAELRQTRRPTIDFDVAFDFATAFKASRSSSIDAFLARLSAFADVGKGAIAAQLLAREKVNTLFSDEGDDWIQYLLDRMDAPWDDMPKNKISFVTFNYDRTLERYLTGAWAARFERSSDECEQLLESFPIVHLYGQLGSLRHGQEHVPFGGRDGDAGYQEQAASGIIVIPEGRDDTPAFKKARELIGEAHVVGFLGFGFDTTNVQRLGGRELFSQRHDVTVVGTALGMTDAELRSAADRVADSMVASAVRNKLFRCECRAMLRETLILGP